MLFVVVVGMVLVLVYSIKAHGSPILFHFPPFALVFFAPFLRSVGQSRPELAFLGPRPGLQYHFLQFQQRRFFILNLRPVFLHVQRQVALLVDASRFALRKALPHFVGNDVGRRGCQVPAHLDLRIDLVDVLSATAGRTNERHFQLVGGYVNEFRNDPIVAMVVRSTTAAAVTAAIVVVVVIVIIVVIVVVVGRKEADSVPISKRNDLSGRE